MGDFEVNIQSAHCLTQRAGLLTAKATHPSADKSLR